MSVQFFDVPVVQMAAVSLELKVQRCKKKQVTNAAQQRIRCNVSNRDAGASKAECQASSVFKMPELQQ